MRLTYYVAFKKKNSYWQVELELCREDTSSYYYKAQRNLDQLFLKGQCTDTNKYRKTTVAGKVIKVSEE
jgi:hypothetical protein